MESVAVAELWCGRRGRAWLLLLPPPQGSLAVGQATACQLLGECPGPQQNSSIPFTPVTLVFQDLRCAQTCAANAADAGPGRHDGWLGQALCCLVGATTQPPPGSP